jgi:hypothetical protein
MGIGATRYGGAEDDVAIDEMVGSGLELNLDGTGDVVSDEGGKVGVGETSAEEEESMGVSLEA